MCSKRESESTKRLIFSRCFMNRLAPPDAAYVPTEFEHLANIFSHGFCVVPALAGMLHLLRMSGSSSSPLHFEAAFVYGVALVGLFSVSTAFHALSYHRGYKTHYGKDHPLSNLLLSRWISPALTERLQEAFHIGDRAVIYFFIAASYTPWLILREVGEVGASMRWMIWVLAAVGTAYQYCFHERFKWLDTLIYLGVAVLPALVLTLFMTPPDGLEELACGGIVYILGVIFFKCDGRIPCAHAIWHLFVFVGASVHYYAVCRHLLTLASPPGSVETP